MNSKQDSVLIWLTDEAPEGMNLTPVFLRPSRNHQYTHCQHIGKLGSRIKSLQLQTVPIVSFFFVSLVVPSLFSLFVFFFFFHSHSLWGEGVFSFKTFLYLISNQSLVHKRDRNGERDLWSECKWKTHWVILTLPSARTRARIRKLGILHAALGAYI